MKLTKDEKLFIKAAHINNAEIVLINIEKKVIDSSEVFYKLEDKWLLYLKCRENNMPVPKTILLSENLNLALKELKDFSSWPVVLKRIEGTHGEYVEKADNPSQAKQIIKKFWKKGSERLPIIAQEIIISNSYRVTWIGNKVVQSIIKKRSGWKATGSGAVKIR